MIEGLYKVIEESSDEVIIELSDASHLVFQAHFPGNPILPGFVHLEIISKVFSIEITGIKKAKFTSIVLPLERVIYTKDGQKFKVTGTSKDIASFSIV